MNYPQSCLDTGIDMISYVEDSDEHWGLPYPECCHCIGLDQILRVFLMMNHPQICLGTVIINTVYYSQANEK